MWILKPFVAAAAATAMIVAAALAADETPGQTELGPPVGAKIPVDLATVDSTGTAQDFDSLVGDNGMALFFMRSLDWCPYCRLQALEVAKRAGDFTARDLSVVFITYDSSDKLAKFDAKWEVAPTLLSDEGSKIIDAFGIRNEQHEPGSRAYGIPHPVVFIVTPDGTIRAKLYEDDFMTNDTSYRKRPEVDAILEAVDGAIAVGG
ncbi:MAG: peroxiredoxin family protein [Parvularculaceae bacterium]